MAYQPAADRPTQRYKLATNPEFWVEMYTSMSWGDRKALRDLIEHRDQDDSHFTKSGDIMALRLIKDWNLDDANAEKLPITQESLDVLHELDMAVILDAMAPVISPSQAGQDEASSKKKTSTSKSEPSSPSEDQAAKSPSSS